MDRTHLSVLQINFCSRSVKILCVCLFELRSHACDKLKNVHKLENTGHS